TQTVATLRGRDVDIEFVKPESGAVAFFTTMHVAKGSREGENAYKYFDTVISAPVQSALMQPPNNFIPVNRDVKLAAALPMASLDEMAKFVRHDWSKINPLRAAWIERFNKEVAKCPTLYDRPNVRSRCCIQSITRRTSAYLFCFYSR